MDKEVRREIILDNYQNPTNRGLVNKEEYLKVNSNNDSCIDNIDIEVKIENNKIEDMRFDGEACAISTSATSIMINTFLGKTIEEAKEIIKNYENMIDENGDLIPAAGKSNTEVPTSGPVQEINLDQLNNYEYLTGTFYTIDGTTMTSPEELNAEKFLEKNLALNLATGGPKVLIYHTHSQEAFADSVDGDASTTIMGVGGYLAELLNTRGIETIHHEGIYDLIDGKMDRSKAYQLAEPEIRNILKENPSIEVVIDLHRDGVAKTTHLVTEIHGKPTAQIMFFNGLSRTRKNGEITYLNNPYREDNLATSFQMQLMAARYYPGFTRRIYLKSYRYNMNLAPKSMLIEAGAQTNTVEEMRNAMEVLADVLDLVLTP